MSDRQIVEGADTVSLLVTVDCPHCGYPFMCSARLHATGRLCPHCGQVRLYSKKVSGAYQAEVERLSQLPQEPSPPAEPVLESPPPPEGTETKSQEPS